MAVSVVMPALEMAQETGKLVAWLKHEGDSVRKGEMLLEIETDKAVVEIDAAADGILAGVTAKPGDVIPVGHTIAWLVAPGEAPPASSGSPVPTGRKMDVAPPVEATAAAAGVRSAEPTTSVRVSPKARRLAREHGVDVNALTGSGPNGEILAEDILRMAAGPAKAGHDGGGAAAVADVVSASRRTEEPSSIGRIMAERTTQSWTTVPHFFVSRDVDATALLETRERTVPDIERSHGVKVTHTDLMVASVAHALRQHARMNASWSDGTITVHADVNIALAMAVDNAVVTAVIHNADRLSLGDLARQRRGLADRARANRLQPGDIAGATFTISNLGMFGVDAFTAIIVPPQAGILAVGAITDRVVAVNGLIGVRPMMTLTLSSDHRVVDGVRAAAFLNDVVIGLTEYEGGRPSLRT